jgi:hypothetical protein
VIGNLANEPLGKSRLGHSFERLIPASIIANGTDEADFMPQIVRVPGEVERRAAQVPSGWKNVPEHLAGGDNFHPQSILDHLQ